MANNWFQFKEFKIEQDQCGMKVSTDACIQGALAADFLVGQPKLKSVLDIGTGTGLLSLMLAQKRNDITIDALEIDEQSALQASENFKKSKWATQLSARHSSLQNWAIEKINLKNGRYDFIICNPPFFQNHLQSEKQQRNTARHNVSLNAQELIDAAFQLLNPDGFFCMLYPENEWEMMEELARKQRFHLYLLVKIQPKSNEANNRVVAFFSKRKRDFYLEKKIIIYQEDKVYTDDFIKLMQVYYLYL